MTDNELIQHITGRSEDALGALIDRYGSYVAAVIYSVSAGQLCKEDVEELAADTFTALWENAEEFAAGSPVKPYLARIARNKTVSLLRKNSRFLQRDNLPLEDNIIILEGGITDELAIRREQEEILNEAVSKLGQPDREIFIRFYFLGEKVAQIAQRLLMNQATVRTKLRRSRGKLKESFQKRGYKYYED